MKKIPACKRLFLISLILVFGVFLFVSGQSVKAGYGEAGVAPVCVAEKLSKPWLYAVEVVDAKTVDLHWDKNDRATSWTFAYGVESGKYVYGLDRFGNNRTNTFRIGDLPPASYYFVIRVNNGCMPGEFSNEQSVTIGRPVAVTYVSTGPLVGEAKPKVSPKPTTAPGKQYVPPSKGTTPKVSPSPRVPKESVPPIPTPTPTPKQGFFQRIIDFLFGWLK